MKTKSAYQPTATTRAYYQLNGNSVDISGNGNTGTDTAIAYQGGRFGRGAYLYDDTSDIYCQSASFDISGSQQITQSIWFKATALVDSSITMIQEGSNPAIQDKALSLYANGKVSFYGFQAPVTGCVAESAENSYVPNIWYNLVGTYDGTNLKVYLNGVEKGRKACSSTQDFTNPRFRIRKTTGGAPYWVDEVIVDSRAWTSAEVSTYYRKSKVQHSNALKIPTADTSSRYWVGGSGTWNGGSNSSLTTGIVSYYTFDTNSNDSVGSNNGTDTNISYVTGKINNGATANSTNIPDITVSNAAFNVTTGSASWAFWVKSSSYPSTDIFIPFYLGGGYNVSGYYGEITNAGQISFLSCQSGATQAVSSANGVITTNTWYHCVFVKTSTTVSIYVNGVSVASGAVTNPTSGGNDLIILNYGASKKYRGPAIVDEFGFWSRPLTPTEILELYNSDAGITYPFNIINTANWALTSNGAGGATAPAFGLQPVFFDASSGVGTTTLTTGTAKSITFTGFTGEFAGSGAITLSGDLTFSAGMTNSYTGAITFNGTNQTLTTAGKTILSSLVVAPSGNFTLADNLTLGGSGTVWSCTSGTIVAGTTYIKLIDATSTAKTFAGGGKTYNNLWLSGAGTGAFIITGANVFNDFKCDTPPHTITFPASVTTSVSTFTVNGTAGNLMTLQSSSSGTRWKIRKNTAGVVSCDYLSIKDSQVLN